MWVFAGGTDVPSRAIVFAAGAKIWFLPEVFGRVAGGRGGNMADVLDEDCSAYVGGRYLIRRGAGCGLSGAGGMFAVGWSHGGRPGFEVR
jgi:hypothetical protein